MKKVLVFELNNYHTETFPIYRHLLPSFLHDAVDIEYYVVDERFDDTARAYDTVHRLSRDWFFFLIRHLQLRVPFFVSKINRIISRENPDLVVFNSIEPERNYRVFKKINAPKKVGLVHNPKKSGITQGSDEFYFVLGRQLFENFRTSLPLDGYLLPYFRQFDLDASPKRDERLVIAVQGLISFKRRDYPFLVEAAKRLMARGIEDVVFDIIGNRNGKDGPALCDQVRQGNVEDYFRFYDRLDDRDFFQKINDADCILTLLHKEQERYYHDKTTASFSHAAAYGKVLIMSRENASAWGMDEGRAILYEGLDEFIEVLLQAREGIKKRQDLFRTHIAKALEENKTMLEKLGTS